jgi:DNA-binding response OmpR family regulator
MPAQPPVVAVFNTSEDTTDLLRYVLEHAGLVVVTAFTNRLRDGLLDYAAFMREHRPQVIVYDVAIPYEPNWRLFEHFRASPASEGVQFVVTTTNVAQLRRIAGGEPELHEIIGKPYDLDEVVRAVKARLPDARAGDDRPTDR